MTIVFKFNSLAKPLKFCNAKSVKKIPAVLTIFISVLTVLIFFIPIKNAFAQSCDPNDSSSCGPGLQCLQVPEDERENFECQVQQVGFGEACKADSLAQVCAGLLTCIPDSPGNENGKCGTVKEGSFCSPSNTDTCGPRQTTPLICKANPSGDNTCQRVACDPSKVNEDCKGFAGKNAFFCIQEAAGAFCGFENLTSRNIKVIVRVHDKVQLTAPYTAGQYKVQLFRDRKMIKEVFTDTETVPAKGDTKFHDINVEFGAELPEINPGEYEVCLPDAGQCQDVVKEGGKASKPNPVVFNVEACAQDKNAKSFICEDPIAPPPPPCEFRDAEKCRSFNTAIGSLSTNPGKFVSSIFAVLLALSGAIALILILRAGYKMMTSKGEPEKIKDAREQLIAAIVGLMFLIFSLVFLELIGFGILQIPGFQGS